MLYTAWCMDTSDLRHFRPKTFRHYVFGAKVSQIFALMSAPVPKCLGQFGTKVHEILWGPELKNASSVAIVLRNVHPLYICYCNGMKVLGK